MKITIYVYLVLIFLSCKNKTDIVKNDSTVDVSQTTSIQQNQNLLSQFISETSFEIKGINKEEIMAFAESVDSNVAKVKITIQIDGYGALGWVLIDFKSNRVFDITNDIQDPIEITYNEVLYKKLKTKYVKEGIIKLDKTTTATSKKSITSIPKVIKSLLGKQQVGLSIKEKSESDPYKRFWVDETAACFCNSPSIYIDDTFKNILLYNYCDNGLPPHTIGKSYKFKILGIENKDKVHYISLSAIDAVDDILVIEICETSYKDVFEIFFRGQFSFDYIGKRVPQHYTIKPDDFTKAICDDFGG